MKAACLYGAQLRLEERPDPIPGDRELLVAVDHAGICGSDVHADTYGLPDGFVLGHELSGEIVGVGRQVDQRRVGERVAVLPVIGCGECGPCRSGVPTHCRTYRALGVTTAGGFAQLVVAGDRETFRLPDHLGHQAGALIEPLAVGLHTVQRARLDGLERVLVQGAGPIGLAVTAWLASRGGGAVVVSDPVALRRELALQSGADAVIDPVSSDVIATFRAECGRKPDVIFDCAGGRLGEAVVLAARDAKIVVAGYHADKVPVDTQMALIKELDVIFASWYTSAEFAHTIDAVARDRLPIEHMITHRVTLDELPGMYASLKTPNDQGKVLVDMHRRTT
jgi:(R,R)-butanediol dehydrogenase / meso-butanediol dehydrogenase / diacetyl reductase